MKSFSLPQTDDLNKKRAAQAAKRRANWLTRVPDQFTMREAVEAWEVTDGTASALLQKMVKHRDIEPVTSYHKPRLYRKVPHENT